MSDKQSNSVIVNRRRNRKLVIYEDLHGKMLFYYRSNNLIYTSGIMEIDRCTCRSILMDFCQYLLQKNMIYIHVLMLTMSNR
mgnify:FL=1